MKGIPVACSGITYGQFNRAVANAFPEESILDEIARAGYEGATSGPRKDRSAAQTLALFNRYGLRPVSSYLGADFWKPENREKVLEQARTMAAFHREVGCLELYVACGGFDYVTRSGKTRSQLAGQITEADAMTDDQFKRCAELLNETGEATLKEGVRSCFHNHVGSTIETRQEIDRLMELADEELLFLGPDTGHLAWAGASVGQFCRDYAKRIKTIHLKDIDAAVRDRGRAAKWEYKQFTANGVIVELGEGCIDYPAVFATLAETGYSGWIIVETDVTQKPTAMESITVSRTYLRGIGV